MRQISKGWLVWTLLSLTAAAGCSSPPKLQSPPLSLGGLGTGAFAVARGSDGTTYLGGQFTLVSAVTGGGVALDAVSAQPKLPTPKVEGAVLTTIADGHGGWYIGGAFESVGGLPRKNLAHLSSDTAVDPAWAPEVDDRVYALALRGGQLLVGGAFHTIGTVSREHLAELDPAGTVTDWNPAPDGSVYSLVVNGSSIYVGGRFDTICGVARSNLAVIDNGATLSSWAPNPDDEVDVMLLSGKLLYVGGYFTKIGGSARAALASFTFADDALTDFAPALVARKGGLSVSALAVGGGNLYVGGVFSSVTINGVDQMRSGLAAFDGSGTLLDKWDPSLEIGDNSVPSVGALTVSGNTLFVGGYFDSIGGQSRANAVALDATTGLVLDWNPIFDGGVWSMALRDNTLFAGGSFLGMGGIKRNRLAAIDRDGSLTSWDPNVGPGTVNALLVEGDTIYVGGEFSTVGGLARVGLAAVDRAGAVTPWNPELSGSSCSIKTLASGQDGIYVAGQFSQIGTDARTNLGAVDRATGKAAAWAPADFTRRSAALLVSGTDVFCSGVAIGGGGGGVDTYAVNRYGTSSSSQVWSVPLTNNPAEVLALVSKEQTSSGGPTSTVRTLYVGGIFSAIGTSGPAYLGALDADTGALSTAPVPTVDGYVSAMTLADGVLYIGGDFTKVGDQKRLHLAAFDPSGALTPWAPALYDSWYVLVYGLAPGPGIMDVAGGFTSVDGKILGGYARVSR